MVNVNNNKNLSGAGFQITFKEAGGKQNMYVATCRVLKNGGGGY